MVGMMNTVDVIESLGQVDVIPWRSWRSWRLSLLPQILKPQIDKGIFAPYLT